MKYFFILTKLLILIHGWSTIILMFHLIIQTSVITQSLIKSSQWAKKRKKQCNRVREGQQNWQNLIAPQALFQQLYI